ncbi:hypothetical protein [Pantoea coffeiphila]|uniref:hypothetical protein n=1 Tax=Pantoea coffeiphila TaxID=1465635 RepID=UPI001EF8428C|nr:hypothetical protein [Pantoea coffeiphila]MBM7344261.1 hypothetical protein [Pantoea coffeiphila]
MKKVYCREAFTLCGVLLCMVPALTVQAAIPNMQKKSPSYDYHSDPLDPSAATITPKEKSPDLFGETTGPLPFFGKEARERGYDLPDPYGIGYTHMDIHQNIKVKSINFSNLKFPVPGIGSIPVDNMFNILVGHTREKSKTDTARLDTWLFPFMNVYGIVGHTRGRSVSNISACITGRGCLPGLKDIDFTLKFKGTTWGGGTTLAYGYHDWFGTMDFNYTETHFDVLDGNISAFTFTPRVGYRFTVPGVERFSIPVTHASLWVGTMYQDVDQDFKGNISDLHMPAGLSTLVNMVNRDDQGRFRVKQHLKSPWNILVGGQYELTRNFNITSEVGFSNRNSFMVGGEFRF